MTTKKPREFWILTPDMSESSNFVKGTYLCSSERPSEQHIDYEYVIHVREALPEPTVDSINKLGKEAYDQFLIRYHEKPDFSEAYLMGFRAALAWMKGER